MDCKQRGGVCTGASVYQRPNELLEVESFDEFARILRNEAAKSFIMNNAPSQTILNVTAGQAPLRPKITSGVA